MSPKQIIFKLETKVGAAIELIRVLKQKNKFLTEEKELVQKKYRDYENSVQSQLDNYKERVDESEEKILELEKLVDLAQKEQSNLEKSVTSALINFDTVEELKNTDNLTTIEEVPSAKEDVTASTSKESMDATMSGTESGTASESSPHEDFQDEQNAFVEDKFDADSLAEESDKDEESFEIFP